MKINNPEFVLSAYSYKDYPNHDKAEIAFVGRSNVGKSSLINMLVRRKKLARISSTPGRTQSINFFNIDNKFYFVDLPGYGFAKVPKKVKDEWGELINDYLYHRDNLKGIVMIVDSRHKPSSDDQLMLEWIRSSNIPFIIAATKEDKLSHNKKKKQEKLIKEELGLSNNDNFCLVSSKTTKGKSRLFSFIGKVTGQFK